MPRFLDVLFGVPSSRRRNLGECILKGALDDQRNSQEVWDLKTKWGHDIKVLVSASPPGVGKRAVSGTICVIMPIGAPETKESGFEVNCNVKAVDEVSHLDLEGKGQVPFCTLWLSCSEWPFACFLHITLHKFATARRVADIYSLTAADDELSNDGGSPRDSEDQFLAALEQPPSPYSDKGVCSMEMFAAQRNIFADQVRMQLEGEGTSVCSQDWCKSDQGSQSMVVNVGSVLEPSSLTRARVMVVDPRQRGRKSLTLMLERCGFEVSCACSGTEAKWRFEQSMQDPEGFSVIFVSLSLARSENYSLVREIRRKEQSEPGNSCLTTPVLIVAVTDVDRYNSSHALHVKDQGACSTVEEFYSRKW